MAQSKQLLTVIPQTMNDCKILGHEMSKASLMLPQHLQNKPQDCMAVAMVAAGWGMNPFMVAQKTHVVSGKLGYEAQLVNSVISSSKSITGRFKYKQIGDWSKIAKKNWLPAEENGLGVQVGVIFAGEDEITWGETIWLAPVTIRNSPVWKTQPYVQLCYLALKYFARLYLPDVIMGVYDREELESMDAGGVEPVDITPSSSDLNASIAAAQAEAQKEEIEDGEVYEIDGANCKRCQKIYDKSELNDLSLCKTCEAAQKAETQKEAIAEAKRKAEEKQKQKEADAKAEREAKAAAAKADKQKEAPAQQVPQKSQRDRRTAMIDEQGSAAASKTKENTTANTGKVAASKVDRMTAFIAQQNGKGYKSAKAIYDTATDAEKSAVKPELMNLYKKLKAAAAAAKK